MRIGLLHRQQPFAEYNLRTKTWQVWTVFDKEVKHGTYFELFPDGTCDRVTTDPVGVRIERVSTER